MEWRIVNKKRKPRIIGHGHVESRSPSLHVRCMAYVCPSRLCSCFWLYRFRTTLRNRDNQSTCIYTASFVLCPSFITQLQKAPYDALLSFFRTLTALSLFRFALYLLMNRRAVENKLIIPITEFFELLLQDVSFTMRIN